MKFNLDRSITVNASPKKVAALVADFKHWSKWSPWTIAEPDCDIQVKGEAGVVGHQMSWDGEIIGSGKITLSKKTDHQLAYELEFLKPFKSTAKTSLIFKSTKKGTQVIWTMEGNMPFFLFFMIPMMKGWVSMDYDRGLRMLKALAEDGKINAQTTNKGVVQIEGFSYVGLKRTVTMGEVGKVMQKDFDRLIKDMVKTHGKSAEHWVALYPKFNMRNMTMTYIAAVSDEELQDIDLGADYVSGKVTGGKALEIFHKGSYDFMGNPWSMGMMYLRAKKMKQNGVPFERYWNSPKEVAPEKLETSVYFPIR